MTSRYGIMITIFLILVYPINLFAGWTEDVRITDRGSEIYPQIIARNDTLHVAWHQIVGDHLTSYMRSLDGGDTWSELVDLSEQGHRAIRSDLSLSNDLVTVGWADEIFLETISVGYSVSSGGGGLAFAELYSSRRLPC